MPMKNIYKLLPFNSFLNLLLTAALFMGYSFGGYAQNTISKTTTTGAVTNEKQHYVIHSTSAETIEILQKCISKYPNWHKHRMLTKRRVIEIKAPYTATIELYSETELHQIYGKRILPGISDNDSDYTGITLEVTPSGFKEIIKDDKAK
jgi:hypothetical protein